VRFLWRFDFKRFRRLCLFIFRRRFFLRFPIWSRPTNVRFTPWGVECNRAAAAQAAAPTAAQRPATVE
jgi:hypothetical protein